MLIDTPFRKRILRPQDRTQDHGRATAVVKCGRRCDAGERGRWPKRRHASAAHIKDVLCVLRWVENPRDAIAAFRVLQLLPGVGPAMARAELMHLSGTGWEFTLLNTFPV